MHMINIAVLGVFVCFLNSVTLLTTDTEQSIEFLKKKLETMQKTAEHDIVFLVDGSGSVEEPNYRFELKFVRNVLNGFNVNPNFTRVAVITFSDNTAST